MRLSYLNSLLLVVLGLISYQQVINIKQDLAASITETNRLRDEISSLSFSTKSHPNSSSKELWQHALQLYQLGNLEATVTVLDKLLTDTNNERLQLAKQELTSLLTKRQEAIKQVSDLLQQLPQFKSQLVVRENLNSRASEDTFFGLIKFRKLNASPEILIDKNLEQSLTLLIELQLKSLKQAIYQGNEILFIDLTDSLLSVAQHYEEKFGQQLLELKKLKIAAFDLTSFEPNL